MTLWELGLIAIFMALGAHIFLAISIFRIKNKRFRTTLSFLFVASIFYMIFSAITVIYGYLNIGIESNAWTAVPYMFFVAAGFWSLSMFWLLKIGKDMRTVK